MRVIQHLTCLTIVAAGTIAHAAALPVGVYTLTGAPGTGIHVSDPGTFGGIVIFNAASTLIYANLTFHDNITSETDTFNLVGPTGMYNAPPEVLYSTITDSANPALTYAFSIAVLPGNSDGSFKLTCDTDCDTDINNSNTHFVEELTGSIVPAVPEPSSFVLLGTGALGVLGATRRRFRNE